MKLGNVKIASGAFLIVAMAFSTRVQSQVSADTSVLSRDLTAFENPGKEWTTVSNLSVNPYGAGGVKVTAGSGIILGSAGETESRLATHPGFGDVVMEFDFLLSKGTRSAVSLEGRYKLDLSDSWAETTSAYNNMGGLGRQKEADSSGFSGVSPLMNVAKAPGLWQHARILFRAPQFSNGRKTTDANFEEVYINGCLVQENIAVKGISAGSTFTTEEGTGQVVFTCSKGNLAIKDLRIRKAAAPAATRVAGRRFRTPNPIMITPEGSNTFLRSFLNFRNKKRTHVISVGDPHEVNYSYDLKQGALLQVWNGPFMDVTEMWEQRGEPQLAKPLGSVVELSEMPTFAVLPDANAAWPDSVAFENLRNDGYVLDKQRNPTFLYETGGYSVRDKISPGTEGRALVRQLSLANVPANLYCRVAAGSAITALGKGLYVVGDKSYFVQIDEALKPFVRNAASGAELMVPMAANKAVSYSLIW